MSKNIKPIVYMLTQKLIQDSIKLGAETDWTTLVSYNSQCKSVEIIYFKEGTDYKHWFHMQQYIDYEDAEQNLRNFIGNVHRLIKEYEDSQEINRTVSLINMRLNKLHERGINLYDYDNPEWRIEKVEYDPSADEIFFECIKEEKIDG